MPNGTYGGVRGRKTKVGRKLLRFPPTRSPDSGLSELSSLEEAVANFSSECVRKLRMQHSCCTEITVFAYTSRFRLDLP